MFLKPTTRFKETLNLTDQKPVVIKNILQTIFKSKIVLRQLHDTTLVVQLHISDIRQLKDFLSLENATHSITQLASSYLINKKRSNSCFLYSISLVKTEVDFDLIKLVKFLNSLYGGVIGVFYKTNFYWFDLIKKNVFTKQIFLKNSLFCQKTLFKIFLKNKQVQLGHNTLY